MATLNSKLEAIQYKPFVVASAFLGYGRDLGTFVNVGGNEVFMEIGEVVCSSTAMQ